MCGAHRRALSLILYLAVRFLQPYFQRLSDDQALRDGRARPAFAAPSFAQFETATVVGTVRDTTGAVVPDAKVTLTNRADRRSAERMTDANGNYEFFTVRIGAVPDLRGEGRVFDRGGGRRAGDRRRSAARRSVDGGGPGDRDGAGHRQRVLLQTDSSERSQVITGEQTRALPLNGRAYSSLALLSPGVRASPLAVSGREGSFNVNGLRSTFNNFLIDGVDNNAYGTSNQGFSNQVMQPSPDAVEEFKVVTNNMSAEYGRSAGATINVAYASGTNQFRGSGWEFARRTKLNAMPLLPAAPTARSRRSSAISSAACSAGRSSATRRSSLPTTRGSTKRAAQTAITTIATADQRQGILTVDVRNPLTGELYPAGTPIPMTDVRAQGAQRPAGTDERGRDATTIRSLQNSTNDTQEGRRQGQRSGDAAAVRVRPLWLA